jgi:hypothetical protein
MRMPDRAARVHAGEIISFGLQSACSDKRSVRVDSRLGRRGVYAQRHDP